jgi:uncharacterized membrane protein
MFQLITCSLALFLLGFWFAQVLDIVNRSDNDFPERNDRVVWLLVVLLIPIVGAILYASRKPPMVQSSAALKRESGRLKP